MNLSVNLVGSDRQISEGLYRYMRPIVVGTVSLVLPKIEEDIKNFIQTSIRGSHTWQSLFKSGTNELGAHFGIPRGQDIEKILETWIDSIEAKTNLQRTKKTMMTVVVQGIKSDYSDVFALSEAETLNISKRYPGGQTLPWLEWLLEKGDTRFIKEYVIEFGSFLDRSRSGGAIMVHDEDETWGVPTEHASRGLSNFLTDAIEVALKSDKMVQIFQNRIANAIK